MRGRQAPSKSRKQKKLKASKADAPFSRAIYSNNVPRKIHSGGACHPLPAAGSCESAKKTRAGFLTNDAAAFTNAAARSC